MTSSEVHASRASAAVYFHTHVLDPFVAEQYRKLRDELPRGFDLFLLLDASSGDPHTVRRGAELGGDALVTFTIDDIAHPDYPQPWAQGSPTSVVPGNNDLLWLHLQRTVGPYRWTWVLEYDVAFSGNWNRFFEHFSHSGADLLGTTLQPYEVLPEFYWWNGFEPPYDLPRNRWLRALFPIARISARGLDALHEMYIGGWSGHHEVVVPTGLREAGLELEDFGGDGPFVRPENRNRFYTNTPTRTSLSPGTFVYRPARRYPGLQRRKLWHPVKPSAGRFSPYLEMGRDWLDDRLDELIPGRVSRERAPAPASEYETDPVVGCSQWKRPDQEGRT